jgi:hypothetical protein
MTSKEEIINNINSVLDNYNKKWKRIINSSYADLNDCIEMYTLLSDTVTRLAPNGTPYYIFAIDIIKSRKLDSKDNLIHGIHSLSGVASSLKIAYENDFLITIHELINADIFEDFLEMSEYLLKENYKDAAAVIIGGVLEEHLRKLCQKNNIQLKKQDGPTKKSSQLNDELSKLSIYHKGDNKSIIAWLDIRNNAAHGKFTEYSNEQVDLMLKGVRNFISRYPA